MTNTFYGKYGPGQNTLRKPAPETQHTPTPWKFQDEHLRADALTGTDEGNVIASFCDQPLELNWANAAFIVRAVNAHDDLVWTLQEMVNQFGHYCEYGEEDESELAALQRAVNLLAKINA